MPLDSSYPKMPFGKYAGKTIDQLPSSYLWWMIENLSAEKHGALVVAAEEEHNYREHYGHWED